MVSSVSLSFCQFSTVLINFRFYHSQFFSDSTFLNSIQILRFSILFLFSDSTVLIVFRFYRSHYSQILHFYQSSLRITTPSSNRGFLASSTRAVPKCSDSFSCQSPSKTSCVLSELEYQYSELPQNFRGCSIFSTHGPKFMLTRSPTDYSRRPLSEAVLLLHDGVHFSLLKILPSCSIAARRESVSLLQGNRLRPGLQNLLVRFSF